MYDYPVVLTPDPDGGFVVTFPDVPEAVTQADDEDEALLRAADALETALSFYVDDRRPLPVPSPADGLPVVRPSALESIKLSLYSEMLVQGVRKAELARRLNWHLPQVDRLLKLNHASQMGQLESAFRVLGKRVSCTVEEA
jgi:antitoxin HicB